MRRSELAHERQKTNLAERLVSKSWLRCTDKNFADFAKNGVFQHNQPKLTNAALRTNVCYHENDQKPSTTARVLNGVLAVENKAFSVLPIKRVFGTV